MRPALAFVAVAVGAAALLSFLVTPASAATTFTQVTLTAVTSGSSVVASTTIRASTSTVVEQYGICVRDSANRVIDFPAKKLNVEISSSGTSYVSPTKTFTAGTYVYYPCVRLNGSWSSVGRRTFTVSSSAMPTRSVKPGWTYSYGQDFTAAAALGEFDTVYGAGWAGYDCARCDTSRNGSYRPRSVLSVANGLLDMYIHHDPVTGENQAAAPFPQPPAGVHGSRDDYLGMRTAVRFRASNPIQGYKTAWLYWPASWNWNQGEVDFPEGDLDGTIGGYSHEADTGNPSVNTLAFKSDATYADGWHTAVTEWIPGRSVELFLDGVSVGRTTQHVPTAPMKWILQTETGLSGTAPSWSANGHVQVDWLTVESYTG
jgi:hypothetical protein